MAGIEAATITLTLEDVFRDLYSSPRFRAAWEQYGSSRRQWRRNKKSKAYRQYLLRKLAQASREIAAGDTDTVSRRVLSGRK